MFNTIAMTKTEKYYSEYNDTDRKLHWLSQVIAKVNKAFVPPREDDSHTNFSLDSLGNRLFGRWIDGPDGRIILSLNLHSMTFEWFDENQNLLIEVQIADRSMDQLLLEVSEYPDSLSMDKDRIFSPLHYEIPDYGIKSLRIEDVSATGLDSWLKYRDLANISCQDILTHLQAESEIRIWPHHFDTGIYAGVTKDLGLGFGLAMKDSMVGAPYFYLAGYGEGVNVSGPGLPELSLGRWETGGPWKGAVLPLDKLSGKNYSGMLNDIRSFIREVSDWYMHITENNHNE